MIVSLDSNGSILLHDARNFRAFSFLASGKDLPSDGADVLFRDDHAWVSLGSLRTYPDLAGDAEWQTGLDAMVDFAKAKGWVDASGKRLRAHIERAE